MARIARWDRELAGPLDRIRAWTNMLFADHGILRLLYPNRGRVSPELWRSSQPSPGQVAWFAKAGGKTIVNLRGGREHGSWPLERDACRRHHITLADFVLRSREAPDRDTILGMAAFLEKLEYPVLVHCKSGADRAGLFAALFLILRLGASVADARRELGLRYGHFRQAKTGILDAFLDAFEREGEAKGLSFEEWARDVYDPEAVTKGFKTGLWSTLVADRLLRRE
jgi:protein tyrosine/serine phosphatase